MNDQRLESIIGNLLRAGVLISAVIVLAGGVMYLAQNASAQASYHAFVDEQASLRSVQGIVRSAAHFDSRGLIQFGLLLLIATPVARVIMAVVGFYLERDRMYAIVSLIVLAVLVFSLLRAT
ncbi:MAG TPA: DUF1634 domain-containing protein [Terracidiphilus sp.]|nr:DUF1634 domain-containing protein [Terracidiphilus sp.]